MLACFQASPHTCRRRRHPGSHPAQLPSSLPPSHRTGQLSRKSLRAGSRQAASSKRLGLSFWHAYSQSLQRKRAWKGRKRERESAELGNQAAARKEQPLSAPLVVLMFMSLAAEEEEAACCLLVGWRMMRLGEGLRVRRKGKDLLSRVPDLGGLQSLSKIQVIGCVNSPPLLRRRDHAPQDVPF